MSGAASVRVGVLSFAHYHANFWSEALVSRGALAGIWDDDEARGREAAGRFGTEFHADLDSLLARCTAVAVCSETREHRPLIERAAARGLAVLCEKPLGTSYADAERIAEVVRASGIAFMQSFPKRFDPVSHRLRDAVQGGELGDITLVRVRHGHFYGLQPDFKDRWYVDPARSGGGALLDEGVHGADLLAWLFGMPAGVTARISDAALRLPVEDLGIAIFDFPSGLVAELTASFSFAAADASIEFYGTRGTLLVAGVDLASRDITEDAFVRVWLAEYPRRAWRTEPLIPRFKLGQFHHQNALAFVDSLAAGTPPPVGLDDGLRALKMIDAAYVAARTGQRQVFR
jgi:predicted dehydrogenase